VRCEECGGVRLIFVTVEEEGDGNKRTGDVCEQNYLLTLSLVCKAVCVDYKMQPEK
jgi:hypothetical protein